MRKKILNVLVFLVCANLSQAQTYATTKTDKTQYLIGDYIRVQLNVTIDSTYVLNWPTETEVAPYDLITSNPVDTVRMNASFQLSQEIVYSIYDAGEYYLPSLFITYKKYRDTSTYFVVADSTRFIVEGIAIDTTAAIKPIKDIIQVKTKNYLWVYLVCGLLLLAVIGIVIYYVFFKNKNILPEKKNTIKISMFDRTLQLLKELEEKKLWQQDNLKDYYSELTDILRAYLEKRFGIQALESTTDEILIQLERVSVVINHQNEIRSILELADLAKFAKSRPLPAENIKAMEKAVAFVLSTKPPEETTELKK